MSRYERRTFFESLCELRDRYAALPHEDRTAVMSIDAAIAWAEAELAGDAIVATLPADQLSA